MSRFTTSPTRWQSIHGWFNFQRPYTLAIDCARPDARLVEVGAYCGCSTSYLAELLAAADRRLALAVVDTWQGTAGEHEIRDYWPDFLSNMSREPDLRPYFTPYRMASTEAAGFFADGSIDFLFLDGDHSYAGVRRDLEAWLPKCRGVVAGHDWKPLEFDGICQAVRERFGDAAITIDPISTVWAVAIGSPETFDAAGFLSKLACH